MTLTQLAWECNDEECDAGYSESEHATGGRVKTIDSMKQHIYRTGHEVTVMDRREE